jgi:Nitroreductase family
VRTTLTTAQWRDVLASAVSAPSVLNTQPWLFTLQRDRVELHADKDRQLQVLDPHGRQLLMSCGAALLNLRLAVAHLTCDPDVRLLPNEADPLHIATVRLGRSRTPTAEESALFAAIPKRRTNRRPFSPEPPPAEALTQLRGAAESEGAGFTVLHGALRTQAVAAVRTAEHKLQMDSAAREEVARWIERRSAGEGIPREALGVIPADDEALVRDFGAMTGQVDRTISEFERNPTLAAISTPGDEPIDWIRAGQAMERMHLTATSFGLAVSYLGQPFEVGDRWWATGPVAGISGVAQMILRLGYAPQSPATPRRPVEDVLRSAG